MHYHECGVLLCAAFALSPLSHYSLLFIITSLYALVRYYIASCRVIYAINESILSLAILMLMRKFSRGNH